MRETKREETKVNGSGLTVNCSRLSSQVCEEGFTLRASETKVPDLLHSTETPPHFTPKLEASV